MIYRKLSQAIGTAARGCFRPLGLHLLRATKAFEMQDLLKHARHRGVQPGTIVDVGASDGKWSMQASRHFPNAQFLLFEPLAERAAALAALARRRGFQIINAAAGDSSRSVRFTVADDLDASGVSAVETDDSRTVPMESIDDVLDRLHLPSPYLIKLDTHGFELPVLEGAVRALRRTDLLIIEAYNYDIRPGVLRFPHLCLWLEARGFRCIDMADPMRRPKDQTLWQLDLAFAPQSSPDFRDNRYH